MSLSLNPLRALKQRAGKALRKTVVVGKIRRGSAASRKMARQQTGFLNDSGLPRNGLNYAVVVVSSEFDSEYIPFYLDYYRALGVVRFLFVVHSSGDRSKAGEAAAEVHRLAGDSALTQPWVGRFHSDAKLARINGFLEAIPASSWVAVCDIDEHFRLNDIVRSSMADTRRRVVYGRMIDRLAELGEGGVPQLHAVRPDIPLAEQFPLCSESFSRDVLNATCFKPCLVRGGTTLASCHHQDLADHEALMRGEYLETEIDHYKWKDTTLAKLRRRAADFEKYGLYFFEESKRAVSVLESADAGTAGRKEVSES